MKRVYVGLVILICALGIAGGLDIWRAAGEMKTPTTAPIEAPESPAVGSFQTKLGDCFSTLPTAQGSSMIENVDCSSGHHWEVVFQGELGASSYNAIKVQNEANLQCNDAVIVIVKGLTDRSKAIFANASFTGIPASPEEFNKGERSFDCFLGSYFETYSIALTN